MAWLWAAPTSAIGILLGALAIATGGGMRRRGATLEFYGGALRRELAAMRRCGPHGASAMTFGHVILGVSVEMLDRYRRHELVHVRQCERWGPLFIPAYLLCSAVIWTRGGDAYRDNPFEREAYGIAP